MYKLNKRLISAVSVISIILLSVSPAAAHGSDLQSNDSTNNSDTVQASTDTNTSTSTDGNATDSSSNTSASVGENESTSHEVESLRAQANHLLAEDRGGKHEHTQAQRQNFCEQHQTAINAKVSGLGSEAETHLAVMNKIFTEVQAYQAKNQLSVSNYDTLVATATTDQTNATTAVDAFKAVDTTIDCTSSTVASTLATIKTAADNARTSLQAYRVALHSLISALQTAANASTSTSASTSTTTTTENQ